MRIAQLANNFRKAYPKSNNAIYSHAALLTNALVERGNDVDMYASGDSETKAKLISVTEIATADMDITEETRKNLAHLEISKCYKNAANYDIIHSHFSLLSSFYANLVQTPTVQSLHIPIKDEIRPLLSEFRNNYYVSFSLAQRQQMPELNWAANIYHGLDLGEFKFNPEPGEYLLYLGRITSDKGVHLAIEAAQAVNMPLVIAGRSYQTDGYWHNHIEKKIDGKMIQYVGEADYQQKRELLQKAKALLFPTQVPETFGLSMIEALASGTPVIGWDNGSVREVIQDRHTGYVVNSVEGLVKGIQNIDKISRQECRDRAEKFFSLEKMVTGYEKVYLRIIEEHTNKIRARQKQQQ
jgi:glycosyltransferase involved in cell wall biosynthesis